MGCDIHVNIEHRRIEKKDSGGWKHEPSPWWRFFGPINPGRDYTLFGLMAQVRGEPGDIAPRGLPEDVGSETKYSDILEVASLHDPAAAERWVENRFSEWAGSPGTEDEKKWVTHPDNHSHSWLTLEEFREIFQNRKRKGEMWHEWEATLVAMEKLAEHNNEVRIVFWFDN